MKKRENLKFMNNWWAKNAEKLGKSIPRAAPIFERKNLFDRLLAMQMHFKYIYLQIDLQWSSSTQYSSLDTSLKSNFRFLKISLIIHEL